VSPSKPVRPQLVNERVRRDENGYLAVMIPVPYFILRREAAEDLAPMSAAQAGARS